MTPVSAALDARTSLPAIWRGLHLVHILLATGSRAGPARTLHCPGSLAACESKWEKDDGHAQAYRHNQERSSGYLHGKFSPFLQLKVISCVTPSEPAGRINCVHGLKEIVNKKRIILNRPVSSNPRRIISPC